MVNFSNTHIIVLAAGSGSRFGAPLPKQFCTLGDRPVVMHTIDNLRKAAPGAEITLVISPSMESFWTQLCAKYGFTSPNICHGGASRFESSAKAIASLPADIGVVMIHDAARPFTTRRLLEDLHKALDTPGCHGAIPAIPVTDSLRIVGPDGISRAVDRGAFRSVQTPQAFPFHLIKQAFDTADPDATFTDDASVMEAAGMGNFILTKGDTGNIKITNPTDMAVATLFMQSFKVEQPC